MNRFIVHYLPLIEIIKKNKKWFCYILSQLPLNNYIEKPVFLTGCGRSGTTILGETLSRHPSICYLNEPRYIWISCYPETDIWSSKAPHRNGRPYLTGDICTPQRNRKLRNFFYYESFLAGKPRFIEKLPINTFRLNFIHTIFPDALFLHIIRNGIEVAHSIEKMSKYGWFGVNDYKWNQLVNYAQGIDRYKGLPRLCQTDYERGLLEWRLSVDAALDFYQSLSRDKYLQVTYESLVENPVPLLERIEKFIDVQSSKEVHDFAKTNIKRKSPKASSQDISASTWQIAGDLLERLDYL